VLDALDRALESSGRFAKQHDFRIADCGELRGYQPRAAGADEAAAEAAVLAAVAAAGGAGAPQAAAKR